MWNKFRNNKFLFNVSGAIAFYLGFVLLFALAINLYTNHGSYLEVPDVRGKEFAEAEIILKNSKLEYTVADSTYDEHKTALAIIEQNPKPGSSVKSFRTIYLTVNSKSAPQIQMPDLRDVSLKSASMILTSYGLKVGALIYKPDLAKDAVLDQLVNGKSIKPGTNIKKGVKIDLVLGDGLGQTEIDVPNLIGSTLREAKFILDGSSLNIGAMVVDASVKGDTLNAVVYKQIPDPLDTRNNVMNAGEGVDVFLTSPEKFNTEPKEN